MIRNKITFKLLKIISVWLQKLVVHCTITSFKLLLFLKPVHCTWIVYVLSEPRNVGLGQRSKFWWKTTLQVTTEHMKFMVYNLWLPSFYCIYSILFFSILYYRKYNYFTNTKCITGINICIILCTIVTYIYTIYILYNKYNYSNFYPIMVTVECSKKTRKKQNKKAKK